MFAFLVAKSNASNFLSTPSIPGYSLHVSFWI